jgi:pilus assembly protein Flp/PilA
MRSLFCKTAFALLIVLSLLAIAMPAMAQNESPEATALPPEQVVFFQEVGMRLGWLLLVIGLDVVLGVTSAIKAKTFEWQKLSNFIKNYVPLIIGWLALEALGLLPENLRVLAGLGATLSIGAYTVILVSAAGSVLSSVRDLGILPANVPGIANQKGQGLVEYALIIVLIAITVIVVLALVGTRVSTIFSTIASALG